MCLRVNSNVKAKEVHEIRITAEPKKSCKVVGVILSQIDVGKLP